MSAPHRTADPRHTVDIQAIFRAGFVRRWHTNPDLAHTVDPVDGHSARVARIILALHPVPSLELITAALLHDDGESVTGDVSAPEKGNNPALAKALADAEYAASVELWGSVYQKIPARGKKWLKFADRLDAYMWARHHAPHVMGGDDWPEAKAWLVREAEILGVSEDVEQVLS